MSEYYLGYTGAQLDEAVNKVASGYILPSGKPETITENGNDIDIARYEKVDINVPVPAGYINITELINHCTQSASGTFAGSGQTINNLSIGLNFRPKIILIVATSALTTSNTESPYETSAVWRIYDNDFNVIRDNCVFVFKSGSSARTGHTVSNGLRGNSNNTITGWGTSAKFASGVTYSWYAWG